MDLTQEIEKRKQRWCSLYEPAEKGQRFVYVIDYPTGIDVPNVPKWPEYKAERIEAAWKGYLSGLEHVKQVEDDYVPFLNMISGTEIFAECFGCKIYRPTDNMPFAVPFIHSAEEAEKLSQPRLEDTPLMMQFEMADILTERAGKDALLSLPDMQSPMDVVAQIWDKSDLFVAMLEEPEAVKTLSAKVLALQEAFLDEWFKRYGKAFIAHHPSYYMPKGITMSVDEIGSVSRKVYDEFFAEELNELSDRYGGIGIHSCSDSVHQWDGLARVKNLKLLNLYRSPEVVDAAYKRFAPVCAQWHIPLVNTLIEPFSYKAPEEYPAGTRMVMQDKAASLEEAKALCEKFGKMYR